MRFVSSFGFRASSLVLAVGVAIFLLAPALSAQLAVVAKPEPQNVFGGAPHKINVTFHNAGTETITTNLDIQLFQTSSSTAVLLGQTPWKKLEVLPGQTVLESAEVNFPAVRAATRFQVQWAEGTNAIIGVTSVMVYPTNLLALLRVTAGEKPPGVLDPQNRLKPLLQKARVEFEDLGGREIDSFDGKLALLGPFTAADALGTDFGARVKKLAAKGVAVVWIPPPAANPDKLKPPFYVLPAGKGTIVVGQAELFSDLANDPLAQLRLLHLADLATHPQSPELPRPQE